MNRNIKWSSRGIYEHPEPRHTGFRGSVVLTEGGNYFLLTAYEVLNCPQAWAKGIHEGEIRGDYSRALPGEKSQDLRDYL